MGHFADGQWQSASSIQNGDGCSEQTETMGPRRTGDETLVNTIPPRKWGAIGVASWDHTTQQKLQKQKTKLSVEVKWMI